MKPTDPPVMTLARFAELLDAYGARLAQWPAAERAAAERFAQTDAEAQRLLASDAALDAWLETYAVDEVSPRLMARVLEVPALAQRKQRRFGFRLAWAVAFSCLVGLASGALTAPDASADDDEWAELTEVSFYSDVDADPDLTAEEAP